MIDHLIGRPSAPWKRTQVFLVIFFWVWRLVRGSRQGPRFLWLKKFNRYLSRFTPWQVLVGSMTILYTSRNLDTLLGLGAPDPLARLYSKSYYRATWIATGLDAGFATAMSIRQKWLRDICSVVFSLYYLLYANAADEKLRKHRAVCTVEMLRATWEKTNNPYIRAITRLSLPSLPILRKILIPRPSHSKHSKPVLAWLYFAGTEEELAQATDLILDCPGGGFVAMTPEHHEERLRLWTVHSRKPVLAVEYGKAPEYPYPWAIEEVFDLYQSIVADQGRSLGMSGTRLEIIMAGDSAGGNLAVCTMLKILEHPTFLPRPQAIVLSYPALDFNFTSWMSPSNLAVLRSEASSAYIPGLSEGKDHLSHKSPLSMIDDLKSRRLRKKRSWKRSLSEPFTKDESNGSQASVTQPTVSSPSRPLTQSPKPTHKPSISRGKRPSKKSVSFLQSGWSATSHVVPDTDSEGEVSEADYTSDERPLLSRVRTSEGELSHDERLYGVESTGPESDSLMPATSNAPLGTRLTMTSRTGYFQDRIISPSMMRAMAILYIGPNQLPDFERDYYISPILAPEALLAQFPTVLLNCGEKDPFVDDTVIFAGRIRQAKLARKQEVARLAKARAAERGESIRLCHSSSSGSGDGRCPLPGIDDPLRILAESDEDWVQMRIVEGWSHGYLQMHSLIPQVKVAIQHLAGWMEEVFASHERARDIGARSPMDDDDGDDEVEEMKTPKARRTSQFVGKGNSASNNHIGASETETDDQLTFVPKKKRSPPTSFSNIQEDEVLLQDGAANRETRNSSSGETLAGPVTPDSSEVGLGASPGSARRRGAADVATKMVNRALGAPVAGTRTGTPLFAQAKQPLSEAELMKRRREEAVHGLVSDKSLVE